MYTPEIELKSNINDELVLTVECNKFNWEKAREDFKYDNTSNIFYIEMSNPGQDTYTGINVEQAKELIEYLTEKIKFVEED